MIRSAAGKGGVGKSNMLSGRKPTIEYNTVGLGASPPCKWII